MIVAKAANMARMMDIPILGIVENMSYIQCPDCGKQIKIFGESHLSTIADKHGIRKTARIPMDPAIARACDNGSIELYNGSWLDEMADYLENL